VDADSSPGARVYSRIAMERPEVRSIGCGEVAVFTTRSPIKETENEDAAALLVLDDHRTVLVVADGLGGHAAGAEAASTTLAALIETMGPALEDEADEAIRTAIISGIELANRRVDELGVGAATTLAVVEIDGRMIRPYHVGDSEILVTGQRGKVKLQTISHSPVAYAVEAGILDDVEAMYHEDRHLVSNIVGRPDMRIEIGSQIELSPRDTLLMSSDGLIDNMYQDEIVEAVRKGPLNNVAETLLRICRQRMTEPIAGKPSKPDDLTFVVFRPAAKDRSTGPSKSPASD
jgi:serine/threonine protein phosphatase PrpC